MGECEVHVRAWERVFGDVMKFRARSSEREENAWVLVLPRAIPQLSAFFYVADGDQEIRDYRAYEPDVYGDNDDDDEKCPEINLPRGLGGKCEVSDFCSNITCEVNAMDTRATIIFKINRCDDPVTATVAIKLPGFSVDWSHTFKDGEEIELPTDGGLGAMGQVAVSLKVGLKKEGEKLHFKVKYRIVGWTGGGNSGVLVVFINITKTVCLHEQHQKINS